MRFGLVVLFITLVITALLGIAAFIGFETANRKTNELNQSIAKIRELSAVASQLQQKGQTNEANQFLNIAGLVLQDKINNPKLKEALLDSSLVLGYQYLVAQKNEGNKTNDLKNAEIDFKKILPELSEIENKIENNPNNLATLVYINYVKGKLEEDSNNANALADYKKAFKYISSLESPKLKSNLDLFTLDLNILYNGNADIVALLYRQLKRLDGSNPVYDQSLKKHFLNELDYLMQQQRWRQADFKTWQFLLYSAGRIHSYLDLTDIRNFKCDNLKKLDVLWVNNSNGHFGYSVQKKIYLASGNSLDFDWEKGMFKNWNEEKYNDFTKRVGWKGEDGEWTRFEELPMNLVKGKDGEWTRYKELPMNLGEDGYRTSRRREKISRISRKGELPEGVLMGAVKAIEYISLLQRLVNCNR